MVAAANAYVILGSRHREPIAARWALSRSDEKRSIVMDRSTPAG
jgi:hypothetical protein